jgi:uncharacterized lipoprotein YmbA
MKTFPFLATGAIAGLVFSGCTLIETRPDPSRFYVLDSPAPARVAGAAKEAAPEAWPLALAVARVQTPSYLDQPQLVSRSGGARVTFSEFNRWLEPMDKGSTRVFANSLASRLGAGRVALEPTLDTYRDGVLVQVNLLRFDGELGGEVTLIGRYRVSSVHDGSTLLTGETTLREKCDSSDYPTYAGTLGKLLDAFAADMAKTIRAGVTTGSDGLPVKAAK